MKEEGVTFVTGANVGKNYKAAKLLKEFDSVVLACGINPRDIMCRAGTQRTYLLCGRLLKIHHKEPVKF